MSKKILSVALALVLALSCFAVSAFALGSMGYEEADATYTQAWELATPVDNGDGTWSVDVKLTANYSVGAVQFTVENTNNTGVQLTGFAASAVIPAEWEADVAYSNTSGKVMINANPTTDAVYGFDASAGVVIGTLTYTVTGDATATINIKNDPKTATTPGGTLIAARMSDGNVVTGTAIVGQTVTSVGSSQNIGAVAAPADLALTDTGTTAGVAIDTTHTFGGAYKGVVFGFVANNYKNTTYLKNNLTATNGGSLSIKTSDGKTTATGNYGSGSTIEVLNADGTSTGNVYVVVIFGDVDGNGLININDATATAKGNTAFVNNSVPRMAANCQMVAAAAMMHTVNVNDALVISKGRTAVDQVALAAKMATLTGTYYK